MFRRLGVTPFVKRFPIYITTFGWIFLCAYTRFSEFMWSSPYMMKTFPDFGQRFGCVPIHSKTLLSHIHAKHICSTQHKHTHTHIHTQIHSQNMRTSTDTHSYMCVFTAIRKHTLWTHTSPHPCSELPSTSSNPHASISFEYMGLGTILKSRMGACRALLEGIPSSSSSAFFEKGTRDAAASSFGSCCYKCGISWRDYSLECVFVLVFVCLLLALKLWSFSILNVVKCQACGCMWFVVCVWKSLFIILCEIRDVVPCFVQAGNQTSSPHVTVEPRGVIFIGCISQA